MLTFTIKKTFHVTPEKLFKAWLSSELHSNMTGGEAHCSSEVGGKFTAWDGYISGTNFEIDAPHKIVQKWRTTEFQDADEDSIITIELQATAEGSLFTLSHAQIPDGQPDYKQGWHDHYFEPMEAFFSVS